MEKILPLAKQLSRAKWLPPFLVFLSLLILGGTIWSGAVQLRKSVSSQIISRDAELLDAVAMLEQLGAEAVELKIVPQRCLGFVTAQRKKLF